jgi:periplasmic protein TonB
MDSQKILSSNYLDLLFDGRNKQYGGYELRRNYAKRMRNALLLLLSFSACTCGYAVLAMNRSATTSLMVEREITLAPPPPVDLPKPRVPPPPRPPAPPPPLKPTVAFKIPTIVDDNKVDNSEKPLDQSSLKDKTPDAFTLDGDSTGIESAVTKAGKGTGFVEPPKAPTVERYVEQMPEAPYDVNSYLSKNIIYPAAARENNIEGRVVIQFIVNEDGGISNAEVVSSRRVAGGLEQEALRVVKSMPKWRAGKQNGRPVKVFFTLPVSFKLN